MTRRLRSTLIMFLLVAIAAAAATWFGRQEMAATMAQPIVLEAPVLFEVRRGDNARTIARRLEAEGWLRDYRWFALRARLDNSAGRLQAGTYEILPGATPQALLQRFIRGDTKSFTVSFIEGTRLPDMRAALAAAPHLEQTITALDDAALAARLGIGQANPEGWFFPATYTYAAGDTDMAVLRRAHARMQRELAAAWASRAEELPYQTPYEALIMASIIEKETAAASERATIAGVFVRRLQRGMKLQTDPTVIYGIGAAFDGNLRRADLRRDTPYNTYTRKGLPPTPIALAGTAALHAALNPAAGKALYFVARGDGTHQFSATLREHNNAVRRYQLKR